MLNLLKKLEIELLMLLIDILKNIQSKKYLNLNLLIDTFKQEADVQKSYCLDIGYNLSIIELMEEVGGLDKSGNADFEKLYHEFMVGIYYNDFGQLITDKIYTILEDDFEEDEGCRMTKEYTGF